MHITFGWGFDTARWTTATTPATLGSVVTGPTGLADILATRLALTRPDLDRPTRIAAYRSALSQVVTTTAPGSWPATGFSHDPWTVARELLAWRDQL
ncbi:MAG: PD-(D/E)XK nuclease family protein, partial [Corynebacterium variabile]